MTQDTASAPSWTGLWLEPLAPLFFGDGRPFAAGESTVGRSIFPPTPATLQGVVRRLLLESACGRFDDYSRGCRLPNDAPCPKKDNCSARGIVGVLGGRDGTPGSPGSLAVQGPWLGWRKPDGQVTPLFPTPLDLVRETSGRKSGDVPPTATVNVLTMRPAGFDADACCSMPDGLRPLVLHSRDEVAGLAGIGGWLKWSAYKKYLTGRLDTLTRGADWWIDQDLWLIDARSGLAIDKRSRTALKSHLYFPHLVQPKRRGTGDGSLVILAAIDTASLETIGLPTAMAVPLGGERKPASFGVWRQPPGPANVGQLPWTQLPEDRNPIVGAGAVEPVRRLKVVLTQPAWFKKGWIPGLRIPGATLVGARVERAEGFGGWDVARNRPKPLRRFVPRGSVYYFELDRGLSPEELGGLWNVAISETPPGEGTDFGRCGFGHAFVGTW